MSFIKRLLNLLKPSAPSLSERAMRLLWQTEVYGFEHKIGISGGIRKDQNNASVKQIARWNKDKLDRRKLDQSYEEWKNERYGN
tara:strand:- start:5027 stop:5278 length:252 start_codon:yes stop_codon:yes gene_type:complete